LRVIAGVAKKRLLKVPSGWTGRPTADRVKESLFNILAGSIIECNFLDLFAGTGNVGIEALSRGALKAVFVEKDHRAAGSIMQNVKITGFEDRSRIIIRDVYRALTQLGEEGDSFDIVFLDPPYSMGFEIPVISSLLERKILTPGGLVIAESSKRDTLPSRIVEVSIIKQQRYGDTMITFYQ